MAREMIEHANAEYPKECCGVLVGPPGDGGAAGEPRELMRLTNVDPDPVMRYNADPKEIKRVYDEIFERDWDIVSIYHSHTHTPAYPSPTDVARALHPNAVYVLVSLQDRSAPDLRAFRIVDGAITELDVIEEEEATN